MTLQIHITKNLKGPCKLHLKYYKSITNSKAMRRHQALTQAHCELQDYIDK